MIIDHLVGVAIVTLANNQLRLSLMDRQWDAATIEELLDAMDRQLPLLPVALALRGERLNTLDTIQWTHTDDGRGSGRMIVSEFRTLSSMWGPAPQLLGFQLPDTTLANLAGVLYAGKAATTEKAEAFYTQAERYARTPAWQRSTAGFNPDLFTEALSYRYALLQMLLPALGNAVSARTQSDMDVAGTRTMLALELFRARQGRYPETLAELVPAVLPELPLDPYCGRAFGYKLRDPGEDPQDPRPYLLYSSGADAADNNGTPHPAEPHTAIRPQGVGTDFIVNQPRPRPEPEKDD